MSYFFFLEEFLLIFLYNLLLYSVVFLIRFRRVSKIVSINFFLCDKREESAIFTKPGHPTGLYNIIVFRLFTQKGDTLGNIRQTPKKNIALELVERYPDQFNAEDFQHNKQKVGEFAAKIRAVRPPEPYQGKGIRYLGEHVRKKEGKKVVSASA